MPLGCGTIFKIDNKGKFSVVYTLNPDHPVDIFYDSLFRDSSGNLYSLNQYFPTGDGYLFELSAQRAKLAAITPQAAMRRSVRSASSPDRRRTGTADTPAPATRRTSDKTQSRGVPERHNACSSPAKGRAKRSTK
jgi:hypothetical protein